MILLEVEGVRKHFGPQPLLDGVSFAVRPGQRIGLVGPNGSGKTTLLGILAGREDGDGGRVVFHPSVHLGYLEQQPRFEPDRTLYDEAQSALAALISLEEEALAVAGAMAQADDEAERRQLSARYDHLQHELQRRDAYNVAHKIKRVLLGLGFEEAAFAQPIASLSGGEQNRLLLAKLLLSEPNLMLLDEPSNHLDIEATGWLEGFLAESAAAMIVVSHDRCFLDRVTNRTLELFRGTVDSFAGNFSAYWQQKAQRVLLQRRTYEKQQLQIQKAREFIRRNAYGQKHAQAEDRRKKLARIVPVEPPREIASPAMAFPPAPRSGDIVLRAAGVAKAYDRPLFADVDVEITRGQRWALLGPNGCGKTTLLGCLLGLEKPDSGAAHLGTGVVVGYFDQRLDELDDDLPAVDAVRPARQEFGQQQRHDLLARFGLSGETALQPVERLSGGERCRTALARLAAATANFLVLDEPTNHLDLWARHALERALTQFQGTVLFVSHDRYFVNRVADHLLVIEPDRVRPGRVRIVHGNYETYRGLAAPPQEVAADQPAAPRRSQTRKGEDKAGKPPPRKRRFPFRKLADLEQEIFARETTVEQLLEELAKGQTHRDGDRVRELKAEITRQQEALATLYEHWDEAAELNW